MSARPLLLRSRARLPRTLRVRLVALLTLVLTVGFAAAALVTLLGVRHVLTDRLDAQLKAAGDRFAVGLEHDDHDADNAPGRYGDVEGQLAGTLGARLKSATVTDAAIVGDHDTADQVPTQARERLAGLQADTTPHSISLPDLGTYRIIVTPGHDGDLQVTGLPAEPVEETIDKLVLLEILVFGVTLLVVALSATGVVRLMLRPLARMAGTAADVSSLPLESGGVSLPHRVPTEIRGSEVDTLARAFNTMLEQVESALLTRAASEDRLRRFIADASHELRTPVAVVRSHAELAQRVGGSADGTTSTLPGDVVLSLERITVQADRMGHLIEDLLLLARLDSGRPLACGLVDIARVALDAANDARAVAPDHTWRLQLPEDSVWVEGDEHALAQALANLLANAAVHTPAATTVTIAVAVAAAADQSHADGSPDAAVLVSVSDNGPGMAAELAAHAFDRFVRGEQARSLSKGSSGLGLPIVAAIAAAHAGTVSLDSAPAGTTVQLLLPLADRASVAADGGLADVTNGSARPVTHDQATGS